VANSQSAAGEGEGGCRTCLREPRPHAPYSTGRSPAAVRARSAVTSGVTCARWFRHFPVPSLPGSTLGRRNVVDALFPPESFGSGSFRHTRGCVLAVALPEVCRPPPVRVQLRGETSITPSPPSCTTRRSRVMSWLNSQEQGRVGPPCRSFSNSSHEVVHRLLAGVACRRCGGRYVEPYELCALPPSVFFLFFPEDAVPRWR